MGAGDHRVGLVAAKVIMFYFSYEVLFAEQRGKLRQFALLTVAALLLFAFK